ncbi:MAG: chromosomal replication initiator protein DnaA [Anaerolineae bacterium]
MDAHRIWQAAQGELQLQMTRATYDTWLKGTFAVSYEDGLLIVGTENPYAKEWLENRLLGTIKRTLVGILGHTVEVRFMARAPQAQPSPPLLDEPASPFPRDPVGTPPLSSLSLNPRYTFETFIVGNSNRLAHAAAYAVAHKPAEAYNPLFLYGGVGLGKTHLLHAIGHVPLTKNPRVLYVSSETFTNDLINSIRNQTTEEFRLKYRHIDVLLVDDIQFIAGKERTQEEFFHTFNTLHAANKQIVISSDRPPKAILTLEERLRSRFEWGLIADIQPPDLETRTAILRFKAESLSPGPSRTRTGHPIPMEVIDFLAHKIQSNIRELEGALNRMVAYASMMGCPLTVEMAKAALQDIAPHRPPSLQEIVKAVAHFYGLSIEDLKSPRRTKAVALPRQVAMYLAREETDSSLLEIGKALGGRDHSTILYGYEKISSHAEEDSLRRELLSIKEMLYHALP